MSTPKLSDDARKAVNAAFEAMSTWREEIVDSEKNSEQVIEKMAEAACHTDVCQRLAGRAS